MSPRRGESRFPVNDFTPTDPAVKRLSDWLPENRGFYANFRQWLKTTGYSVSALHIYGVSARYAIGFLNKPYWMIDPDTDIAAVWQRLQSRPISPHSLSGYHKGLLKFSQNLCLRCHKPAKPPVVHWDYYTGSLPGWLQSDIHDLIHHCQRNWKPEKYKERTIDTLSCLTTSLRWIVSHFPFDSICDFTPQVWYAYLDMRLEAGILPQTMTHELTCLRSLVYFLKHQGRPVCERFLLVEELGNSHSLPKDVPVEQLRQLLQAIQAEAVSPHAGVRRMGRMDFAWFMLMLHSGLRTSEVRSMRFQEIDWEGRRLRIEQSKGLKDRIVFLSQQTLQAMQAYLEVCGGKDTLPDTFFIFRHAQLTRTYCFERMRTYSSRCGIHVTPHQLRHSCATLLLNCGAPVLSVQSLLGHHWVDTTLGYVRLYDGTIAADYYQAMALIEQRLDLPEDGVSTPNEIGRLIALVDSLRNGALNPAQAETVRQLRAGLAALVDQEIHSEVVKVPYPDG